MYRYAAVQSRTGSSCPPLGALQDTGIDGGYENDHTSSYRINGRGSVLLGGQVRYESPN